MMKEKKIRRHTTAFTAFLLPLLLSIFLVSPCAHTFTDSTDSPLRAIHPGVPSFQQAPYSEIAIGVLDLDGRNLDQDTVLLISDRLRYHVSENPIFLLIERNKILQITDELGFQLTGACATDECISQVGNIIGVKKMMAGSIGRAGSLFTLQIRMFDVETSMVEFQEYQNADSIENLLEHATQAVVSEIAQKITVAYNLQAQSIDRKLIDQPVIRTFVADLHPTGVDEDETLQVSERLRVYLNRTGVFQATERDAALAVLQAQDYQIPAAVRTAGQAVDLGKALRVSQVVYGIVVKVGRKYSVKIKSVDVETEQVEDLLLMHADGFGDVLTGGPGKLAIELARPHLPPDL